MEQQSRTLHARLLRYREAANLAPARWAAAMAELEAILEALEARDGRRRRELFARHLEHKRREHELRPLGERLAAGTCAEAG